MAVDVFDLAVLFQAVILVAALGLAWYGLRDAK